MTNSIVWTATGFKCDGGKDDRITWGPTERAATKREAVAIVNRNRKPKTPIVRVGHSYIYQLD